jgi:hypothetical protein
MWPQSRHQNNGPPPDDISVVIVVEFVLALTEVMAAALSSLHPLHPIASFTF